MLLLVLCNAFFAGAEIAVVTVRRSRLGQLLEAGRRGARAVAALREDPERFLATVQIGITVIGASAAAFGGASIATRLAPRIAEVPGLGTWSDDIALGIVVAGISFLSIVLGELVPKSIALRHAETFALLAARPLRGIAWLARPFVWFLTVTSNVFLRPFGDRTSFTEARLSREELQHIMEDATRSGTLDTRTGEIASRALEFGHLSAADVMVPRNRVQTLARDARPEGIAAVFFSSGGHSRIPVYERTPENIVGYLTVKDVARRLLEGREVELGPLIRPPNFVPESASAASLLHEMQRRRLSLAIVIDEYGGFAGIVTIEDLLEELVGELFSEHATAEDWIHREEDGTAVVRGLAPIREVNRALDLDLEEGDWTTVAGLCAGLAGKIPERGTRLRARDGTELEVLEASPRVVRRVRLRPQGPRAGDPG
ncbi:MAG TPA: hemolysin family protein [Planctomycetota bacterium]|nr:hemolysin family protein [Planctomycetota bacterium]